MRTQRRQTTLAAPCTVSGRGYWTGQPNAVTFLPAAADTGIRFFRTDLDARPGVAATADKRTSTPLRTCLSDCRAEVDMVEHVMAALYGLRIDNACIHCTSAEMPAMDGSSYSFALALASVGSVELAADRPTWWIDRSLRVGNSEQWIVAEPLDQSENHPKLELEYQLDFGPTSAIGKTAYSLTLEPALFFEQIAAARTFISIETARQLQSKGLATQVTDQDLLVFDDVGPVNNTLRFPDECARHKLLDLIGDLALTGTDLVGRIVACRSGHQLNGEMADRLRRLAAASTASTAQGHKCAA